MNQQNNEAGQQKHSWLNKITSYIFNRPKDRKELLEVIKDASENDLINPKSVHMVEGVFDFHDLKTEDIMIPKSQIAFINQNMSLEQILDTVTKSGHSRFPVLDESNDKVIGILLAKDLLPLVKSKENASKDFHLNKLLRIPVFIPETKQLDTLLHEFRKNRYHLAMVVDEYGATTGLITIEDVIEQIVGEIEDEYDIEDAPMIKSEGSRSFVVKAITPIDDFNNHFGTEFSDEEVDTIGGTLIRAFGRVPKPGETIHVGDLRFKTLRSDGRRLYLIKVTSKKKIITSDNFSE